MQKVDEQYLEMLQTEAFHNLGKAIVEFRMIGSNFIAGAVNPHVMAPIDEAYQTYFDKVLDEISNCQDLKLDAKLAVGLNRMMQVRRGFVPEEV